MLTIEKLICGNPKNHRDCKWVDTGLTYSDDKYSEIKEDLNRMVTVSKIAHRIVHNTLGTSYTVKWGNDDKLFTKETSPA